jgi:hypothetical protein
MPGLQKAGGDSPRLRAALVQDVVNGTLSIREACERHGLSTQCVVDWVAEFRRASVDAFDARLRQALERDGIAAPLDVAAPQFAVSSSELGLPDLIQIMALGRRDGVIRITHDGRESRLWFVAGEIVDAESGNLRAVAAVHRALALERARITVSFGVEADRPRSVRLSTMELLMEGARRTDECNAARRALGTARYRLAPDRPALDVNLSPAERAVLEGFATPMSSADALVDSSLGDLETLILIRQLVSRRYLVRDVQPNASSAPPLPPATLPSGPQLLALTSAPTQARAESSRRLRASRWVPVLALVLGIGAWSLANHDGASSRPRSVSPALRAATPAGASTESGAARAEPALPASTVAAAPRVEALAAAVEPAPSHDPRARADAASAAVVLRAPPVVRFSPARIGRGSLSRSAAKTPATPALAGTLETKRRAARMQIIEDLSPRIEVVE